MFDKFLDVAKFVGKEMKKKGEEYKQYKEALVDKSDDELIRIVKQKRSATDLEAAAAYSLLKSRGYESEDIKFLMQ